MQSRMCAASPPSPLSVASLPVKRIGTLPVRSQKNVALSHSLWLYWRSDAPDLLESPPMSLQFQIIAGPDKDTTITIQAGDDLMMGRRADAFYRLNDPRVSRSHCQILLAGDQVTVIDNGGSGGTMGKA